jgi:nucleoside-diphosphate-sugar epimerase
MESILITGGDGFLGSWLVRSLVGSYKIIIVERKNYNIRRLNTFLNRIIVTDNSDKSISDIFTHHKIDYIIHAATYYGRGNDNILEYIETNILLPLKLAELGVKHKSKAFINTDSFFNSEKQNYNFLSGYILSKKHVNEWLKILSAQIPIINMKLQHIYGPYDNEDKFVIQILRSLISNQAEIELTPGEQKRDFVYIEDVVSAYLCVLNNIGVFNKEFTEVNVGNGYSISIRDFIKTAHLIIDSKSKLLFNTLPYRENEIMDSKADTKILNDLGWQPKNTLENGIITTIKSL